MRALLFALFIAPLSLFAQDPHAGQKVKWMTLEEAQKAAKADGKPLLIDVYTQWCGPCKMLSANTFMDDQTAEYINTHYHPVKFDAEGKDPVTYNGKEYKNPSWNPQGGVRNSTHELTIAIAATERGIAYPTVVYMNKDGQVLAPVQGYYTPEQLEPILVYFGDGTYLKQQFPEFQQAFKSRRKVQ
ncbi:MAG TPA: DUF255 domain-containing protein [Flavobacteriales bacterium]|jgi:thioredoxin-related protein|nr:DUF255 domain-containing protein [Flavobacteriales bacterium]